MKIPLEFGSGNFKYDSKIPSAIDPIEAHLAEQLEYDVAELAAEGADGLVEFLPFCTLSRSCAQIADSFAMMINGSCGFCPTVRNMFGAKLPRA